MPSLPVVLIILSSALAPAAASATAPFAVLVFGDSIAAGSALPPRERSLVWVARVQQLAGSRLRMINEGSGGRWTDALDEFDAVLRRQPRADILVLALGTNDSANVSGQAPERAARNLGEMVRRARNAYGARLAILIVAPPNVRKDALLRSREIAEQRARTLKQMELAFRELAAQLGCEFVTLYGTVPDASLASDGMHPDAEGNARIARVVLPKLLSMAGSIRP